MFWSLEKDDQRARQLVVINGMNLRQVAEQMAFLPRLLNGALNVI